MEGDRDKCLAAGMDEFLPKPVVYEQLAETIDQVMGRCSVMRHA